MTPMRLLAGLAGMAVGFAIFYVVILRSVDRDLELATEPAPEEIVEPENVLDTWLAGSWYTDDPVALHGQLQGYLDAVEKKPLRRVRALIQPHAGYRWSGAVAAYGARQVAGEEFTRVVVVGLSHRIAMRNVASVPEATHISTPLGKVAVDRPFVRRLREYRMITHVPAVHRVEHSVQIQLPLLQVALGEFEVVPITVGRLDGAAMERLARILLGLIDADTLVIASTDFTHFGPRFSYRPFHDRIPDRLKELDLGAFARIERHDAAGFADYIETTGATVCGRCAVGVVLRMTAPDAKVHLLRYDTSGRISGDYTNSVSYISAAFDGDWPRADRVAPNRGNMDTLSEQDRKLLLRLARESLRHAIEQDERPTPAALDLEIPDALRQPAGVFISIYREGELRGCRGAIFATAPLFEAVIDQTLETAFRDHRFRPIRSFELPHLRYSISILHAPREVDSWEEIEIGKHGIILTKGAQRALFLPQVAPKQGWTLPETLDALARKAGLPPGSWRDGARFEVFEAEVIEEDAE